jgi:hypothetical protein
MDGTFTDYNEHLWDLTEGWVTEGVSRIVYGGTYAIELPHIQLSYSKTVSKVDDVVRATESLAVAEPLAEPTIISGLLSADGTSLTVKPFPAAAACAVSRTLVACQKPLMSSGGGGKYSE